MYSEDGDRPRDAAVTAAGIDHVRLWYHYLDTGDLDACGSLLDENAQLSRPDAPPSHGRDQVVQRQAELSSCKGGHRIYKIVATEETVAVMGSYAPPPGAAPSRAGVEEIEFADFFTLTDKGLLLTCRRYYFVAP